MTDNTGAVAERYDYTGYGVVTTYNAVYGAAQTTSRLGNPHAFTGRELDEETLLYYYRRRTYDPVQGRFKQLDAIGLNGGMNLYEYVRGWPQSFVDPSGLAPNYSQAGGPDELLTKRYFYTCNCGWIDRYHFQPYAQRYVDIYNAIQQQGNNGRIRIDSKQPGALWDTFIERYYGWTTAPQVGSAAHHNLSARLLARAAMQEEADQTNSYISSASYGSGWSYEDITSNMLGALIGRLMIEKGLKMDDAVKDVVAKCHIVDKESAMTALITRGGWRSITTEQPRCDKDPCKGMNVKPYKEWSDVVALFNSDLPENIRLIGELYTRGFHMDEKGIISPWIRAEPGIH
jgi:RHS repeat-associated protein